MDVPDDIGFTVAEIAKHMNLPRSTAAPKIHKLVKEGKLIAGRARRIKSDGTHAVIAVYRKAEL